MLEIGLFGNPDPNPNWMLEIGMFGNPNPNPNPNLMLEIGMFGGKRCGSNKGQSNGNDSLEEPKFDYKTALGDDKIDWKTLPVSDEKLLDYYKHCDAVDKIWLQDQETNPDRSLIEPVLKLRYESQWEHKYGKKTPLKPPYAAAISEETLEGQSAREPCESLDDADIIALSAKKTAEVELIL